MTFDSYLNIVPSGDDTLPEILWNFFLYSTKNLIVRLEEFSALSKQTYTATVAKIITLLTLIQVKYSGVCAALMHVLRRSNF